MNYYRLLLYCFLLASSYAHAKLNKADSIAVKATVKIINQINSIEDVTYCSTAENTAEEIEWNKAGYKNTKIDYFPVQDFYDKQKFTHAADLTLVNLRGSTWDKELIKQNIKKVAEVYQQCGIKIGSAKYVESDPPYERVDLDSREYHDYALAYDLPRRKRPVLFFIRSDIEGRSAFANTSEEETPPVSNTAFITSKVNTKGYKDKRPSGYSPTAHELAHLLCSCSHTEGLEPNIMSKYYDIRNNKITKSQCDTFKKSPIVREL